MRVDTAPQLAFNNDYVWTKEMTNEPIVVRGGFYGGGEDAGLFAVQATLSGEFSSAAIGFRCVKDL